MHSAWRWTAARSIGTSHAKSDLPCQDVALGLEIETTGGSVLAAVVSDGAGTARHAEAGAKMVCATFLRAALAHFKSGRVIEDIVDDDILGWLDGLRDRINAFAVRREARPRDCAATLVGLLAGPRFALVVHIGDGAAVVREEGTSDWIVPSWPFQGEYASTTVFVIDDPPPEPVIVRLPVRLDRVALFSDGMERLVLDHRARIAHGPFFDRMSGPLTAAASEGFDPALARSLRDYLDSKPVCDRTDDDKSLILGIRR